MNELDELIKDRKEKKRLMKKDGDNSHELLAALYGSPTHFITELLQNAEDEGAKIVSFELTENELIFSHDAPKLFDFSDIRAISNFGDNQEKKDKPNAIGRFGIGFKSVYSITDTPRIISSDFDITIIDYNIPERTNGHLPEYFQGTKIILPFKKESGKKARTIEIISKELSDLNLNYLLFLSNIGMISWTTPQGSGVYERLSNRKDKRFISLKSSNKEIQYFLLEKSVQIDSKNLNIKLAFQLDETTKRRIVPCDKSPLFVFFPTEIETNLKFLVHAPFYTTPARESIQDNDSLINIESDHRNEELKKELGKLISYSLSVFKKLKLLNVDLLNVLPIDKNLCYRSEIYKELYNSVKAELCSPNQLLPNSNGGYSSVNELLLLGSSDLADLLTPKQAKKLFGRSSWVSNKITNDKTKLLRDYLYYDLQIPEYDLTGFATKIDNAFMTEQPDKWLIQFYKVINKAPALWRVGSKPSSNGILRSKPIIRVESNNGIKQVIPFKPNGKPNVFLPTKEQSKYATVKNNIVKNKDARKFLEDLGLTSPDLFAEINEFILPKLREGNTYPEYFYDIKKLLEAFQSQNHEKRKRLIQDLKECAFILGYNPVTGETKLLKYNCLYFSNELLNIYFDNNTEVFYVAEEQYSLNPIEHSQLISLLKEIGVKSTLRRIDFDPKLSWQEKSNLRNGSSYSTEYFCTDYKLDGLHEFFSGEISIENSVALWKLLAQCIIEIHPYNQRKFFLGEYAFKFYSDYTKNFDAHFLKQLKNSDWLIVDNEKYKPNDISYSSLPEIYKENGSDIRLLAEILNFKPDEIKVIEEKTGGKFLTKEQAKEWEEFQRLKAEQSNNTKDNQQNQEQDDEGFVPDMKPGEVELNSKELEETDTSIEFNSNQGNTNTGVNDENEENNENNAPKNQDKNDEKPKPSQKLLNDIGAWGQDYVFRDLVKEFGTDADTEIIDLNTKGINGIGADFKVVRGSEIIRIIEVKSTTEKFGQPLSISGTQWEVARNFFKLNEGDKYWIYCVFNTGKEDAEIFKIKNPIQKWKEGKLLAHPVNFVVK